MLVLLLAVTLDLASPQATYWYQQLLADGGYGRLPRERAAFLIRENDGTLTLAPWPHGGFRHASFRGEIPARTIAILHTHPADTPQPSAQDHAEAKRLGIPVVVITPRSVVVVEPSAEKTPARASGTSRVRRDPRTSLRR